jgi:hypothetical protein
MRVDLLLVVAYFRSATPFLSVIRHLSGTHRIAAMIVETDDALKAKTGGAQQLFVQLCERMGATLLKPGDAVHARLMVVQQFPYTTETVAKLLSAAHAEQRVGMLTLAAAGLEAHDAFIKQFALFRAYTPDRRFTRFLLERRYAVPRYASVDLVEVGLPFRSHPVFPEFSVDWLLAAPTTFSFASERGRHHFLRTVLQLMARMPATDTVAYKPHNGNSLDYFTPRLYYSLGRLLVRIPFAQTALEGTAKRLPARLARPLDKLLTSMLHLRVLQRATPMSKLTPHADISLEAFLPGVRKGVIGGLSNVIWGTRHLGLPYLNCVAPEARQGGTEFKAGAADLLDLNIEYFGVPWCNGDLGSAHHAPLLVDAAHPRNLVLALQAELNNVPVATAPLS